MRTSTLIYIAFVSLGSSAFGEDLHHEEPRSLNAGAPHRVRGFGACPAHTADQMSKEVWSHELIGGATAFAAAKAYEKDCAKDGRSASHSLAKEMMAAFAGAEVDKLLQHKAQLEWTRR